jgi:hypothetical protein
LKDIHLNYFNAKEIKEGNERNHDTCPNKMDGKVVLRKSGKEINVRKEKKMKSRKRRGMKT